MDKKTDGLWLGLLALLAFFSGTLFKWYCGWEIELTNCLRRIDDSVKTIKNT
jgi:hypothetical protein